MMQLSLDERRTQALAFWRDVQTEFPATPIAGLIEVLKDPRCTKIGDLDLINYALYHQFPTGALFWENPNTQLWELDKKDTRYNTPAVWKAWRRLHRIMAKHPIAAMLPMFAGYWVDAEGNPV